MPSRSSGNGDESPCASRTISTIVAGNAPPRAPGTALLACVAAARIDGAMFDHWARIAERDEGDHVSTGKVIGEAMGFLVSSYWVLGEAAELGVNATRTQVVHQFDVLRHAQFPKRGEFDRFLGSSGQTVADLEFRVRLNMDSQAIEQRVAAAARTEAERSHALASFVHAFNVKWEPQTYCATGFAVADCGHVGTL